MADELSIGILGYHFMGKAHSNALARLLMFFLDAPDVERSVIIGRDEEALPDAAERFGFESITTGWHNATNDVDVFYNLGPNHLHAESSIAAFEVGASVLCEGPLAPTFDEAEAMRDATRAADSAVDCALDYRFAPAIRYAKRLIESGELDEIRRVRGCYLQDWFVGANVSWTQRMDGDAAGFDAPGDLGVYTIDSARSLISNRAGDVDHTSGHLQMFIDERSVPDGDECRPMTIDGAYTAQAEFENGAVGSFETSRSVSGHRNDRTIEIHGSEDGLQFSLERLNELEVRTGDARGYETVLVTDEDDPYLDHRWPPGHVLGWKHTLVHENYEFLSAVAGDGSFSPSFESGYKVQSILDAIERSGGTGERVSLDWRVERREVESDRGQRAARSELDDALVSDDFVDRIDRRGVMGRVL